MAEKFVSPGVFTQENDLSFLPQGVADIGTAVVGAFPKGPAFIPTTVDTVEEFRNRFGGEDEKYYATYAVKNILENAESVTVVRVGELGGYNHTGAEIIGMSGSVSSSVFLAPADAEDTITVSNVSVVGGAEVGFDVSSSAGTTTYTASFQPTDSNYFTKVFSEDPLSTKDVYVYGDFETTNTDIAQINSASASTATYDFDNQDATHASTPYVTDRNGDNLFKFHTLNDGTDTNTEVKVSIQNVRLADELNTDYGRFDVVVRRFSDTDSNIEVLETFAGCNLNPSSPNYIARKIGNENKVVNSDENGIKVEGDYPNVSDYIRVEMVSNPEALPNGVVPAGFGGYQTPLGIQTGSGVQDIPLLNSFGVVTASNSAHLGIDFDGSENWEMYIAPTSDDASDATVSSTFSLPTEVFDSGSATYQQYRRFTLGFQGGFTGGTPNVDRKTGEDATTGNVLGFDFTGGSQSSGSVAYRRGLNVIANSLEYDYNLLLTPGVSQDYGTTVIERAQEIVEGRGDAFYVADLNWIGDSIDDAVSDAAQYDSSYMATYYPWVKIIDTDSQKPIWVPPSVVIGGVYAFSDSISSEWFAPAGLNRGGINGATDIYKRLYRADMDTLYEAKVNPIVSYPGQGIVAWGQKTLQDDASALDRVNVRRLLINLKKFIASTSRFLVFDQNTNETRNRFLNLVEPYLDQVEQQQGLFAYRVVVDESVNTAEVIDRNQLVGKIYIQPVKAAEFIVLDFNVMPTGAEFPQ